MLFGTPIDESCRFQFSFLTQKKKKNLIKSTVTIISYNSIPWFFINLKPCFITLQFFILQPLNPLMALSATFITPSPSSSNLYAKIRKPFLSHSVYLLKPLKIRASATLNYSNVEKSSPLKVRIQLFYFMIIDFFSLNCVKIIAILLHF